MLRQISLQDAVVYGPLQSRRFGSSLGVNLLPTSYKLCSSNCVYCQYGWTIPPTAVERLKRAAELLTEIERAFTEHAQQGTNVDHITLAGNGEPTLHPDLEELVIGIKALRDQWFPRAQVGILSDSTQVHRPAINRALRLLDVRCMKLDAGNETMWRAVNLPLGGADWQTMMDSLRKLPDIILQSLFMQGSYDTTHDEHIRDWIELVASIRPLSVQVYTVDRAPADAGIVKVPRQRLEEIAAQLTQRTGIPAEVYE